MSTICKFCRTEPSEGEAVCKSIGEAIPRAWFTQSDRQALIKGINRTRLDLATENIKFRAALEAIADGEGGAQEIARQTLQSDTMSQTTKEGTDA